VVNGASQVGGPVSPGEIVTISGSNFGSGGLVSNPVDVNGYVTTSLGGTQALFDGVAAPLLSAQAGQVTAVVPYEVSGNPSTQIADLVSGTDFERGDRSGCCCRSGDFHGGFFRRRTRSHCKRGWVGECAW
jgi:uncharacterized protein (TIGR03437 family)